MELRHLRYFVAVADRLNFRKAADHLHVTQPALSAQIKNLEHELGVRLLERDTTSVRLTDAGAVFRDHARKLLAQAQDAMSAAREAAHGRKGRIVVGNISAFSSGFMSPNLAVFRQKYPAIEVTLVPLGMGQHVAALESGEIQVGFTMGPREAFPPSIVRRPLLRSPFQILLGPEHRLARAPQVALADIAHDTFLAISYDNKRTSLMSTQVRQLFAAHGLDIPSVMHVDGFEAILTVLMSGLGFTIMPEIAAASLPPGIVRQPIADSGADLIGELSVLYRADESSQIVHHFISALTQWSRQYQPPAHTLNVADTGGSHSAGSTGRRRRQSLVANPARAKPRTRSATTRTRRSS